MRGVIWLVLLFAVAVVLATLLGNNDGLVSIYWGSWRTDLSLNLFLVAMVVGCVALVAAAQAAHALLSLPQRSREWRELRRERAAHAALRESWAEYFSARYSRAHKAAQRALALQDDTPLLKTDAEFRMLGHLMAAGSLHRLLDRTQRDDWVRRAQQLLRQGPQLRSAEDGARLLFAEWALEDRDAARAMELLAELPPGVARRTQALRLKLQAARLSERPLEALHTARMLAKHQAFSEVAAQSLLRSLAMQALDRVHDADQLRRLWQELDAADRRDAAVAARAAVRAARFGAPEDARAWLRPAWDALPELPAAERALVALALMDCCQGLGVDWLPRLEEGLRRCGSEAEVMVAAGVAFAERQLWGKAAPLLERAGADVTLAPHARRRAWRTLAALARQEGHEVRAQRFESEAAQID